MKRTRLLQHAVRMCALAIGIGFGWSVSAQDCGAWKNTDVQQRQAPLVDHHTHVLTPRSTQWLDIEQASSLKKEGASLKRRGIEDLLTVMRKDGVEKAAVLSTAYWFGHSTKANPRSYNKVRKENDNIGRLVALYPDQLVAFLGVNPLSTTALGEIKRGIASGKFAGIKLHLTNSYVDLRDPSDLETVGKVFALADKLRVPIVVHMRSRRKDYGYIDAKNFINKVLINAPHIDVQIAHLAGWGGYDIYTDGAIQAFIDYKDNIKTRLYFDIAAIVSDEFKGTPPTDETPAPWWPDERYKQVAKRIREIGVERIVFGTDWPLIRPKKYWHEFSSHVPLTQCELDRIRNNRASWMK